MNMYKTWLAVAAVALGTPVAPAFAAVQIIENGVLAGATGVDVGGTLYDVSFIDGTCASVFSGCDSVSDFAFSTQADGSAAANALFDQVFLGLYDSNPELTRGCTAIALCQSYIPTGVSDTGISGRAATNNSGDAVDTLGSFNAGTNYDSTFAIQTTFARFTLSNAVAAVPEPSTWAMMLMGFGAVGMALRRRRKTQGETACV